MEHQNGAVIRISDCLKPWFKPATKRFTMRFGLQRDLIYKELQRDLVFYSCGSNLVIFEVTQF